MRELLADAGRRACLKTLAKDGSTALHAAAAATQPAVVQLLLDAGARTDVRDRVSKAGGQAGVLREGGGEGGRWTGCAGSMRKSCLD